MHKYTRYRMNLKGALEKEKEVTKTVCPHLPMELKIRSVTDHMRS